jgi:ribosomal subunit interface protein
MQTTVTARHCEIPRTLRAHARRVVERVAKVAHRPQRAQIVFDVAHQQKLAEVKVHLPRGATRVATGEAADFRTALDRAADKLRHQLERASSRAQRTPAR